MKAIYILVNLIFTGFSLMAQTWTWEGTPKAGDNVLVHLTSLPGEGPFSLVYYCFDGTQLIAGDIGIVPSEAPYQLSGAVALHDHVSWIKVVLKDEEHAVISGDERFVINDAAFPKAGLIEKALASSVYARLLAIEAKPDEVTSWFREAIAAHPRWLHDPEIFSAYYSIAKRANTTDDLSSIRTFIEHVANSNDVTSEKLLVHAYRAAKDMADSTLQVSLRARLDTAFPNSLLSQEEMMTSFTKETDIEEKIKIREQFKSRFPVTRENKRMMDQMTSTLVQHYAAKEDWSMVTRYVEQIMNPLARASVSNTYAWTLSGETIESEAPHLDVAATLSSSSLQLLKAETELPVGMTKSEWKSDLDYTQAMYGDTYALILFKQGKYPEAIDHQWFAVSQNKFESAEMNERYAAYLHKAGRKKDLEKFMDQIYVSGKISQPVKDMHKSYWSSEASREQVYDAYVGQLEARAKTLREDNLRKKWKDMEATPFIVKDLEGREVSLADYKGKTVILDFWATWCGPCKASFPGMQKAVEHYAADEKVAFLFIDTWENGEDKVKKVTDFITGNKYTFHVLMDTDNKIVKDYKVKGIPTKFVIGPDQMIRFISVGYSGNNEELVEELKTMVDLIKENTMKQKT